MTLGKQIKQSNLFLDLLRYLMRRMFSDWQVIGEPQEIF